MADKLIAVDIEVATDDLCSVYGCERCPGFVKYKEKRTGQLRAAITQFEGEIEGRNRMINPQT